MQAQIFILASLVENKDFVEIDDDFDLYLLDSKLKEMFEFIMQKRKKGEQVSKVIVFDMFGDENQTIKTCLNYNFDVYREENLKEHFLSCVNLVKKRKIEDEIDAIQKQIKQSTSVSEKRDLIANLSQKIKEKQKYNKVN